MNDLDLAAHALDVNAANLALGHETFEAAGATFVRDRRIMNIYDANHVRDVTAATAGEIDALFAHVEREFEGYGHRMFHVDYRTPPSFEARLQLEGYVRSDALLFVLDGELRGELKPCDIRPIASEADWASFTELSARDWDESAAREGQSGEPSVAEGLALANRWKSPPARFYLAWAEGAPRGYFNAWEGIDGVGQVENLFVHPDWRHRGLATALYLSLRLEKPLLLEGEAGVGKTEAAKALARTLPARLIRLQAHQWRPTPRVANLAAADTRTADEPEAGARHHTPDEDPHLPPRCGRAGVLPVGHARDRPHAPGRAAHHAQAEGACRQGVPPLRVIPNVVARAPWHSHGHEPGYCMGAARGLWRGAPVGQPDLGPDAVVHRAHRRGDSPMEARGPAGRSAAGRQPAIVHRAVRDW